MRNPARKDSRQAVLRLVPAPGKNDPIHLPPPRISGTHSLEECLARRRSTREFASEPLLLADAGQLLWAAQGVTATGGLRTAPSPGAIYPLRVYLVTANVRSIDPGVYRYDPDEHALCPVWRGEPRRRFLEAALGQECVSGCAAMIALSAVYRRVTREFGEHGVRLAQMEAGHAGQNVCLEATALGLGCIGLGRFDPALTRRALALAQWEDPLYLLTVGSRRNSGRQLD